MAILTPIPLAMSLLAPFLAMCWLLRPMRKQVERGRGTRAGGWGRGEEPGPGPTERVEDLSP
jgi:hypothetical protein